MKKYIFSTVDKRTFNGFNCYTKEFENIEEAIKYAKGRNRVYSITLIWGGVAKSWNRMSNGEFKEC